MTLLGKRVFRYNEGSQDEAILDYLAGSVVKLYTTLYSPTNCGTLGFPVLHCLLEFAQTPER